MRATDVLFVYLIYYIGTTVTVSGLLFWRPYIGIIPTDAISGSFHVARSLGLVSTAYGVVPGSLHKGDTYLDMVIGKTSYRSYGAIEVLCATSEDDYQWISTNTTDFLRVMETFAPVRGGIEHSRNSNSKATIPFIGSANEHIGKVSSTDFTFYYAHNEKIKTSTNFDILVYNNN